MATTGVTVLDEFTFLSGTASLVEEIDKRLLIILRDGRNIIGTLRSFDQFANIVLEGAIERKYCGDMYNENHLGIFLIRGENVALLGEIDVLKDDYILDRFKEVGIKEIEDAKAVQGEKDVGFSEDG